MLYRNTSALRRVWTHITAPSGTLELDPGETVDLDGPVSDPHLTPAEPALVPPAEAPKKDKGRKPAPDQEPSPAPIESTPLVEADAG